MKLLLEKISRYWQIRFVAVAAGVLLVIYAVVMPVHSNESTNVPAEVSLEKAEANGSVNNAAAPIVPGTGGVATVPSGFATQWLGENHAVAAELDLVAQSYRQSDFPRDYTESIRRLRVAAEAGNPAAQFLLGHAYQQGLGVPKDMTETAAWYAKAAEAHTTDVVDSAPVTDLAHAMDAYRKAADAGDVGAELYLGLAYDRGLDAPHNASTAARWYARAAQGGSVSAGNNLAALYHNGDGMPRDDAYAASLLTRAAARGSATAQYCLGRLYLEGDGVARNDAQAAVWFEKAAQQGSAPAQVLLSQMYATGRGVQGNTARAYMWINLASATEDQARLSRDHVEAAIAPAEVAEGQKLAHEWITRHPRTL